MTRQEKAQIIDELKDKFSKNAHYYITDASGLSVAQINNFRRLCFTKGVEYRVFKNTLIKKALDEMNTDHSLIDDQLKGFSGVIFSEEAANVPAKVITEYRAKQKMTKPLLKAASIDTDFIIGEENLKMLSELKSKQELIGEVIGLLQSPAKNVVSALLSGKNTIGGLVKALSER
ncbi:50S ribosomal protein L10 [Fulvivirga lutimaris]|uniref:50S ribosomal protein L10 n=1 Tax=Fulvivirga lutimaris TaxID=1819566 RepID=UPI0012BBFA8F|nr:50S ribosomal protein L10 [Fulvivirga lutimaris]MTI40385.1 50S ribosomal protein L10 [Fulvivirga lutimaris]